MTCSRGRRKILGREVLRNDTLLLTEKQDEKEFLKTWRKPWKSKKSNWKWSVRDYVHTAFLIKNCCCRKGKGAWKASRRGILWRARASHCQCWKKILPNRWTKEERKRINLLGVKGSVLFLNLSKRINLSSTYRKNLESVDTYTS